MKSTKLSLLLITIGIMVYVAAQDQCPEPDCTALPEGTRIPDPYNCHKYYICITEGHVSDASVSCDSGKYFNPATYACEDNTNPPCTAACGSTAVCHMYCDSPGDYVGDASSCSNYFYCLPGGEKLPHSCPIDHPYFNGENCVQDSSVCCEEPCAAYCEAENIEIPDPYDCTKYYICEQIGEVDDHNHFSCNVGDYFDTMSGGCAQLSDGATCSSLCSGDGTIGNCIDSMTCTETGVFARCDYCQSTYFRCSSSSGSATIHDCVGNTVFNPVSGYPNCILPEDCPFTGI